MSRKARVLRTRRKRRSEKGRKRGPNRPSRHKLRSGRTGAAHRKKPRSRKAVPYRNATKFGSSLKLYRIERTQ